LHLIRSAALEMLDKNHKHRLQIFTDGSKDPNLQRVSAAFSIPSLKVNKKFRISDNTSILTAELLGIIRALSWVIEHGPLFSVVLTDALSGLLAIKNYSSKSRPELIWEIWHLYNIALKLCYVPQIGIHQQPDRLLCTGFLHLATLPDTDQLS
ncbi:MAG: ribonuclease H family protein, partial [Sedimenticola sp.]